jgi:hypothetical protein
MKTPKSLKKIGNYLPKVIASLNGETAGIFDSVVRHDDWCDLINGKGECNCNPTVETMTHSEYEKRYGKI